MSVRLRVENGAVGIASSLGWDLECVAEEALANAAKHGHAEHAVVVLCATLRAVVVSVSDDGLGPPADLSIEMLPEACRGLRGMRQRADRAGGFLKVEPLTQGTRMRIEVPLCGKIRQ